MLIVAKRPNKNIAGIVMAAVATVGIVSLVITHAAGNPLAFEPENGSLSGPASVVSNSQASGGKAVQFGSQQCNVLPFVQPAASTLRASSKKAFAYYFPPFPVSIENADPANDSYYQWINRLFSNGYKITDRPLPRPVRPETNWKQLDFEKEVRQAIAMGLDGFDWELNEATPDQRFLQLPTMLAAAHAVDPNFRIMLSPDFDTGAGATPDSVVTSVMKYKDDPSIYRLADGRIVLSPFYPERQPIAFWDSLHDKLAAQGVNTALVPIFLSTDAGMMSSWQSHVYGYSEWGGRWVSAAPEYATRGNDSHALGRIWMSPVAFEDVRPYENRYWESSNSGEMRASFAQAMAGNADWVSLTTWNDYTESWMAPSQERGYAPADLAAYYITWLKTGQAPAITQDTLYYFHRSQRTDAPYDTSKQTSGSMAIPYGDPASDQVELLAFLTSPGTLVITQGSNTQSMDVTAAGMASFKVPLVPGTTPIFLLKRAGQTAITLTSKTPIKTSTQTSTTYQDIMYHAGGSNNCPRP